MNIISTVVPKSYFSSHLDSFWLDPLHHWIVYHMHRTTKKSPVECEVKKHSRQKKSPVGVVLCEGLKNIAIEKSPVGVVYFSGGVRG